MSVIFLNHLLKLMSEDGLQCHLLFPLLSAGFVLFQHCTHLRVSSLLLMTSAWPLLLSLSLSLSLLFLFSSDCEEVTPVHLRSVHPSSVPADAYQLPRDDLGDCERSRAQDPLGHGQAHPFPQYSLEGRLCDCPICHLSSGTQSFDQFW